MIRSLKFSQTEKVLVGALSIVALGAGMVVVDSQPSSRAFAIENSVDSDLGAGSTISVDISDTGSDFPTSTLLDEQLSDESSDQPTQSEENVSSDESSNNDLDENDETSDAGQGDIEEEVSVTIDGEDIDPEDFDTNDISIDVENKDTLDGSDNSTEIEVDSSTRQRTRNRNDVDTDLDADANIGDNEISGNENTGRIHNGNVKFNFSLPN